MEETISTKLGNLYVVMRNDKEYPGIMIGLERRGIRYEFAWLEVDQSDEDEKPIMKVHVFDTRNDDPVFDLNISEEYIKELWNEFDEEE
ncbi:MAG: hypothetical protein J6Y20_13015 [Lachnospiraceae bacterium]|nr:hypothetical protein [Lachnospiraceae bacterium]